MNKRILFLILFNFTWITSINGQEWLSKIRPFETNISTAESLLGKNDGKQGPNTLFYKLPEGNVLIDFSPQPCSEAAWGKWNIPEGTIVGVTFYPKDRSKKASFYKLPKKKMEILYDSGYKIHRNKDLGLSYYTYPTGQVTGIYYYPRIKDETLRCKSE